MRAIILLLTFCLSLRAFSQDGSNATKGFEHEAGLQVLRSLGEFGETHPYGVRLAYRHSKHRFGRLDTLPGQRIGLIYGGGFSWLRGRVEEWQNLPAYRYDDFMYLFFSAARNSGFAEMENSLYRQGRRLAGTAKRQGIIGMSVQTGIFNGTAGGEYRRDLIS